jgi:hypothetical protein
MSVNISTQVVGTVTIVPADGTETTVVTLLGGPNVNDAPSDGNFYVRQNNVWVRCTIVVGADGKNYLTV